MIFSFVVMEGKDERGQAKIGKSSQIAFIFILIGFIFQLFYIHFAAPSMEQIKRQYIFGWVLVFVVTVLVS
ncbi:hypothetical protein F3157_13985 [Virgibacillus dakarensis]|uniref:Uncharacterized protein n=1 Tax=Lentibacillus populi TaxID=1827502 RepID=A0A9W5TW76_9BACI|nr:MULTISPECIES: hypothetical protein [Bacillaceae]MBT2217303.1 hypothetical protein [Virgibacillus dakarensis]MTW86763.1 hypothetical protein [Virgibacillus dakarensis]GGB38175.1 hypothetical protein GCM10011409_14560 [Lentibacillus populi]